jgi:hypothetical protein
MKKGRKQVKKKPAKKITKKKSIKKKSIKKKSIKKKITTALAIAEPKPEKPLILTEVNALSNKQLMHMLQRTPADHIYSRPAKGGGVWQYVTGTYVKKVLNYTFGWCWSFEVKDHGKEGKLVWVLGRLTIINPKTFQPMIVKEQFGRADLKTKRDAKDEYLDFGNDLKAASTDALKKCAAELGIASDIYGKNEFREVQATGGQVVAQQPVQQAPAKEPERKVDYIPQVKTLLWNMAGKPKNMTEWAAVELLFAKTGIQVKKLTDLTPTEAQMAVAKLLSKIKK